MTTIKPSGSAVRISQKRLWTFNIACTQKYTKCLHPFHSIISHCATLGVDPWIRWGSHVFMTTIKPSGSAVRISQKWPWTFNIACTQKYAKCLHPFHSIISHCATLGVDPETRWGSHVFMTTIKPSGSAVRISQKWLWTFNISHTQKYTKCLHPFHSIISHCATLGVDPETRCGSNVFMTTIKPSGSAVRVSQKWLWTLNISHTQKYTKCLHPFHWDQEDSQRNRLARTLLEFTDLVIHSDQGREFENGLMKLLCSLLGCVKTRTAPYHPESDGRVERFNRTCLMMLSMFVNNRRANWHELLPFVMHAYRTSVQQSTGYSPFRLMMGEECIPTPGLSSPRC